MVDAPDPPTRSLARWVAIVALALAAVVVSFPVASLASVWGESALQALDHEYESLLADPKSPDVAIEWGRFSSDGIERPQRSELFIEANRRTLTLRFELSVPEDHPLSAVAASGAPERHPGVFMNGVFGPNPVPRRTLAPPHIEATRTEIGTTHIVARARFPTWAPLQVTYRPGGRASEYGTYPKRVTVMTEGLLVRTSHRGRPARVDLVSPETISSPDFAAVYEAGQRFGYGRFRIDILPPPTAAAWLARTAGWSLPAPLGHLAVETLRLIPLVLLVIVVSRWAPPERWRPRAYAVFFAAVAGGLVLVEFIFTRDIGIDRAIRTLLAPVIDHHPYAIDIALVPTILLGGLVLPGLARRAEDHRAGGDHSMMRRINRLGTSVWMVVTAIALGLVASGTILRGRELLPSLTTHVVLVLGGAGTVFVLLVALLKTLDYTIKGALGRGALLAATLLATASLSRVRHQSGWIGEVTGRALAALVLAGAGLGLVALTHLVYTKRVWQRRPHGLGWIAFIMGVLVLIWAAVHGSIGLGWPDANSFLWSMLVFQLPLVAGLVMASVEDVMQATSRSEQACVLRVVGVALLGSVFFTPLGRHLYLPIVFLLGGAFAWWLFREGGEVTQGTDAERRRAWTRLLEFRSMRHALARLTERGPDHVVAGERELDVHNELARGLSRRVATLDPTDEAAGTMRAVFGHPAAPDRWRAARQLTVVALVVASPWIAVDVWVEVMATRSTALPGLDLVRVVASSVLFWSLHGFVLGYFWGVTRGVQVFRKAAWILLLLTLPWLPLTALQAPIAIRAWSDYLGTAGKQVFILAGLSLWIVWRSSSWATVTWRDRIEAFGLRPLISVGSVLLTAVLGIAVAIATDTLRDAITSRPGSVSTAEAAPAQGDDSDEQDGAPSEPRSERATGGGTNVPTSDANEDTATGSSTLLLVCRAPSGDQIDGVVEIVNTGSRSVVLDGWALRIDSQLVHELEVRVLDPGEALRVHEGEGSSGGSDLFLERDSSAFLEGRTARLDADDGTRVASAECV